MPRPYTASKREEVLAEVALLELSKTRKKDNSIGGIARKHSICESTVRRWMRKEKEETAKLYGHGKCKIEKKRGRPSKLTTSERESILNFVASQRDNYEAVTIASIRHFSASSLGRSLSPSYVSRFLRRNGYSSQRATKRPASRVRPTYQAEVNDFRTKWTVNPLLSSMFLVMDESGIWNDAVVSRTYAKQGSRAAQVKSVDKSARDTIVATLRMDGHKLPLYYLEHQRQRTKNHVVLQKSIKGMTEAIMLDYIEKVLAPNVIPGMYLFMDQLSSHKTARVRAALSALGLNVIFYPPKTAPDLSPCDNFFFALFKRRFREKDRSTPQKKKLAAYEAYAEISAHAVRACWKKCKLCSPDVPINLALLPD
jgi:transposase